MARRQQQGGQRRLVGKLEQEDDGEDGEAKAEGVRHADESSGLVPTPPIKQGLGASHLFDLALIGRSSA